MVEPDESTKTMPDGSNGGTLEGESANTLGTETYTKEQLDKAVNDALSRAGRVAAELERKEQEIKSREAAIAEQQKAQALAEEEAAKNDPNKLNILRIKRALAEQQREIDKQKQEVEKARADLEKDKAELSQFKLTQAADRLAQKYGVDKGVLLLFKTVEEMEKAAPRLVKKDTGNINPDSGRSIGGENIQGKSARMLIHEGLKESRNK